MHANDYRLIAGHELRNILRNVCNDPRDLPGRKELRAQLVAALPDAEADVIDALMVKAEEFAREAVDTGARFDLRARADALTLHVLKTYEAADRLVPATETEAVDVGGTLEAVDSWDGNPFTRPKTGTQRAAEQAAEIETAKRLADI